MKTFIAGLLMLALVTGCALTDWLLPSGAPSAAPMTPTYTPLPPTSGVPTFTPIPSVTPTPYPETTYDPTKPASLLPVIGVYLPFEHGFMIYIEGQGCLYAYADDIIIPTEVQAALGSYAYCIPFTNLPEMPFNTPENPFGRVWRHYVEVNQRLGDVLGGAQRYTAQIPPPDPVVLDGVFYTGIVTLPDGRSLYCGTRGATAGTCEFRG